MVPVMYARHSRGGVASIERQLEDCREVASRRGWSGVRELTDHVTASGARTRDGFDALLDLINAGRCSVVIAWTWERLERNRADGLALIEAGKAHNVLVVLVRGSDMDMGTTAGRMVADILGAMGRAELDAMKDRQRRELEQKLAAGQRSGGRRPFGYSLPGMVIVEAEADALRWACTAVLNGTTIADVAREWNARGLTSPQGVRSAGNQGPRSPWRRDAVSRTLRNPTIAGIRAHRGRIVRDAAWPGIVDRGTWEAVQQVLADPSRKTGGGPASLLTGIARCGVCDDGTGVHAGGRNAERSASGTRIYRCARTAHMTIDGPGADEEVTAVILARLRRPDAAELFARPAPDIGPMQAEHAALLARKDALADTLTVDEVTLTRRTRAILARLDEIEQAMRAAALPVRLPAGDPTTAWATLDTAARRTLIDTLCVVTLDPTGRGRKFRPELVRIEWRG